MMNSFEAGQMYAARQDGKEWEHVAALQKGAEILVYCQRTLQTAKYLGVAPRNRKYRLLYELNGQRFKAPVDTLVLESDFGRARDEYLDNLKKRIAKEPFSGLPLWHILLLENNVEVLPDEMCDETEVPRGSTIGYSVQHGKHFACIAK